MSVRRTNRSVADFAGASAIRHKPNKTSTHNTDDVIRGRVVVFNKVDKRTVLVGSECKKSSLVASSANAGEYPWCTQLIGYRVENVFVGIAGRIVEKVEKFPDLSGCKYNTEQFFFFGRRCHGV